jgi:hypothetical protein
LSAVTTVTLYATVELARIPYRWRSLRLKRPDREQASQAGSFLLSVFLALEITSGLDGTEFSGGWLTGPLLSMEDIGTLLFVLALVLTFLFPRVAAGIGLASSLLCLPLYCFFIAPVPLLRYSLAGTSLKSNQHRDFTGIRGRRPPWLVSLLPSTLAFVAFQPVGGCKSRSERKRTRLADCCTHN